MVMTIQTKLNAFLRLLKKTALWGGAGFIMAFQIRQTCNAVKKVVNPSVLDREKVLPEYIYIEDVTYQLLQDQENKEDVGLARIWKSIKRSLGWKLLWICQHGNKEQKNLALVKLAAFKNNKIWDCGMLAQALDMNTAVLLARTRGADVRYFLPPPLHVRRAALSPDLLSYKLRDLVMLVQNIKPHYCINHFIQQYFINLQEQIDSDGVPSKPGRISERDLCIQCLEALYHHVQLFHNMKYEDDHSIKQLVEKSVLPILAEAMLRNRDDPDFDLAVLKILTVMSVHTNLLKDFYQNGLIRELARLLRSKDVRLSSSAAVCLANLSGEYCYRPGLYLLHPIYRTSRPQSCDTVLVHGLRGGVFVTWRQRDRKCAKPIGLIEVTMSDNDCVMEEEKAIDNTKKASKYVDPEFQQVVQDIMESDDESTLDDLEVVLHDVPIDLFGKPVVEESYLATDKMRAMIEEEEDKCHYTFCWPRDWLPKDCKNLRILGFNYWTSLSDWLDSCPMQTGDIATRAADLVPALIEAGVGNKHTPVVWLSHSMGGLIVKQALVESAQSGDRQFKQVSENTKAVLFFSTPHKGSSLATMPRAAAAVLWPSNDVRQLQENSPVLLELHKSFIEFANLYEWETISFVETQPTLVSAFKVPIRFVEEKSADVGRGVFYQLPLDHLTICKPATRQSVLYTTVLDVVQRASVTETDYPFIWKFFNRIYVLIMNFFKEW